MVDRQMCRHCAVRVAQTRSKRGLCWGCYYHRPGVRDLYPNTSKYTPKHLLPGGEALVLMEGSESPLPATPTQTLVGSLAREEVMRERVTHGEALHHPADSRECVAGHEVRLAHDLSELVVPTGTLLRDE